MFSEEGGQTLMELIVVISVSVIIIGALVFATIASLRNAQFSKNQAQATKLAQEGIERVRGGRDRNQCINNMTSVKSWDGNNSSCPGDSVWSHRISDSNSCATTVLAPNCYFKITSSGTFDHLSIGSSIPANAESVPPFERVVILSDDAATFATMKTVTVIVTWTDFSGPHESRLTTILRKL